MKIENLQRAEELANNLKRLKRCSDLLQGGGVVKVYGNGADNWEAIPNVDVKNELRKIVLNKISELEKEVETL